MTKPALDIEALLSEAKAFSDMESQHNEPALYGVTGGKAVGTYIEHKFVAYLQLRYFFSRGNSASGVDFPSLDVDIKVTSVRQPQSSCPFKSARQKVYGLGYDLLVFVYDKTDEPKSQTAKLDIQHTLFIERQCTGDYLTTRGIRKIVEDGGNADDLVAFMQERNLPIDEIEAHNLAEEILRDPPPQGYLTISNALQWRLQYGRAIMQAGTVPGVVKVR